MTPAPVPLSGARFQTDPAALYREIRREHGSVAPVLLDGGVPAWLVIGYREMHQLTNDPVLFNRDPALWNQWENIPRDWPLGPLIRHRTPSALAAVSEEHRKRPTVISNALAAVDFFELHDHVERYADELSDAVCGLGSADLISDYAMLLPVRVMAALYGLADEQGRELAVALNVWMDGQADALEGYAHVRNSMTDLLERRIARKSDDVVSRIVAERGDLSDEEIVDDLIAILNGSHQPTANWIGNTLRLMLTEDRFAASLFGGRSSVPEAMSEVLWEETPVQNMPARFAARDTHFGGQHIHAGDMLLLGFQGANHDPQILPERSTLTGGNRAHFAFSHGEHGCPFSAREIAEVLARTGIEVILDRLPDVDLAVPAEELKWRPSPWMRGLTALPVRFTPTSAVEPPLG
ncbi:cytochrome P450 [Streptomyces sp. ADI93-02]|uniref:cytochrome P450 n=1 Tax=Streptomyces sp. ADI93-02 TaxID=1522757 RepID=UPI000F556300|nr:cytochrome P450 [Streptomyces sp. ADI93-02]RPK33084.1 Cytochrome P450 107B1 [Streptomyces sp. ADI93-02]